MEGREERYEEVIERTVRFLLSSCVNKVLYFRRGKFRRKLGLGELFWSRFV